MIKNLLTKISDLFKGYHCAQKLIDHIQNDSKRVRFWFLIQLAIIENVFKNISQLYIDRAWNKLIDPKPATLVLLSKEMLGYKSDRCNKLSKLTIY